MESLYLLVGVLVALYISYKTALFLIGGVSRAIGKGWRND